MERFSLFFFCVVCVAANAKYTFDLANKNGLILTPRIVGGENAVEGQFPYQVSIRDRFSHRHFCGGAILNSRFILTAGHCTRGTYTNPIQMFVIVGVIGRDAKGTVYDVQGVTPHPEFNISKFDNDISLLRTKQKMVFTDFVQPIALPTQSIPKGVRVVVTGWGQTSVKEIFFSIFLYFKKFIQFCSYRFIFSSIQAMACLIL